MSLLIQFFNTVLTYPIVNALLALYHLVGDFGLAIIILTAFAFVVMLPLMRRQTKVLKAQQALQPEIDAIKKKYPNAPLEQATARQQLFKEHGIPARPPLFPSITQGLIFTGIFFALNTVLRNANLNTINSVIYPFLRHFTSMPDTSFAWFSVFNAAWHISLGLPDPTHILPLITGIITFIQMRMAQPLNLVQTKETLQHSAQIMQLLLPLLFVGITIFFMWQIAGGVALYRLAFLVMSTVRQFCIGGWGSLWTLPTLSLNGNGTISSTHSTLQQTAPRPSRAKKRSGGSSSARRRNKPKHGRQR